MISKKITAFLIFTFFSSIIAFAQFCFRKYEMEDCRHYLVTEVSASLPISLTKETLDRHLDFSTNVGMMWDLNEKIGLGGHGFLGFYKNGGGHTQLGIRPRVSYYFKNDFEVNFSPGLMLYDSSYPSGFAGYSVETNFTWNDHFGITTRIDILSDDDLNGKEAVLNLGIQTDGKKGFWIALGGALIGIVNQIRKSN